MKIERKIYLSIKGKIFTFFSFWHNFNDGSIYIGLGKSNRKFISLHSTGRINYKNFDPSHPSLNIYIEPLYQLTKPNHFLSLTITSLENLSVVTHVKEEDLLFEIPSPATTIRFSFLLAPVSQEFNNQGFYIRFKDLFSLFVLYEVSDSSEEFSPKVRLNIPSGLQKQAIDKHAALIHFHQCLNNTNGDILYSPDSNNEYKLIFSTPMFRPPDAEIILEDKKYVVEIIDITKSVIRFKIKDRHNQPAKQKVVIQGWRLDAEL